MMHSHVFGHRLCESGQMPIFGVCLGEGSDENNDESGKSFVGIGYHYIFKTCYNPSLFFFNLSRS